MKVLVTGGAGFIGSHVVDTLISQNVETYVLVSGTRSSKHPNLVNKDAKLVQGDLQLYSQLKRATEGMDYVCHLGGVLSHYVDAYPNVAIKINIQGTWNLKRACWENGVERIVYGSTSFVYGDHWQQAIVESCPPRPKELYGVTKLAAEHILQTMYPEKVPYTILRLFNVYGPRQYPSPGYSSVLTAWIPKALNKESLEIHDDGTQRLDFVYVKDVARAFSLAIHKPEAENHVFNVGSGISISMNQLARMLNRLAENPTHVHYNREHPAYLKHVQADNTYILERLGWKPMISLEKGLVETINFFNDAGFCHVEKVIM
jgi:UDP-glucose 4-epimerase